MTEFSLTVRFDNGHVTELSERYDNQADADRAAADYIRRFIFPLSRLTYVAVHRHEADYDVTVGIYKPN